MQKQFVELFVPPIIKVTFVKYLFGFGLAFAFLLLTQTCHEKRIKFRFMTQGF